MAAAAVVSTTIDPLLFEEASAIAQAAGLSLAEAFRIMLLRTVAEKSLPFDPISPNAETVAAMLAARRGEVAHFNTVDDLFTDLHADS